MVTLGRKAQDEGVLPVQPVYYRQIDVLGSLMGSPRDFAALLAHVSRAQWAPVIDSVFALDDVTAAYDRLNADDRFGKVVLAL